jgi:hypothetical protein
MSTTALLRKSSTSTRAIYEKAFNELHREIVEAVGRQCALAGGTITFPETEEETHKDGSVFMWHSCVEVERNTETMKSVSLAGVAYAYGDETRTIPLMKLSSNNLLVLLDDIAKHGRATFKVNSALVAAARETEALNATGEN